MKNEGAIPSDTPEILYRLQIETKHWIYLTKDFEDPFKSLVGGASLVKQVCKQLEKNWSHGIKNCAEFFPDT